MMQIFDRDIRRMAIVDDEEEGRESSSYPIEELSLTAVQEVGPLPVLPDYLDQLKERADGVLCDHHLRITPYAKFNGAELAALSYQWHFPAILCTKWDTASVDEMRRWRRFIPALLNPKELNPESIVRSLETCVAEFRGIYSEPRREWRALIRIEDRDEGRSFLFIEIPSWDTKDIVKIPFDVLPEALLPDAIPGKRMHAFTNLGAERQEELYFENWEGR
jgi:hypothetical protein